MKNNDLFRMLIQNIPDLIWVEKRDSLTVEFWNQSAGETLELTAECNPQKIDQFIVEPDIHKLDYLRRGCSRKAAVRKDIRLITKGGLVKWYQCQYQILDDHLGMWCFNDIHNKQTHVEALKTKVYLDALTGLSNRARVEEEIQRLNTFGYETMVVIVMDLDEFKRINDSFGHCTGDQMLKDFGLILKETFRQDDIVARNGGDEFIILLPEKNREVSLNAIRRLRQKIDEYNRLNPQRRLSPSIGFAYGENGENIWALYKLADQRMYLEKQKHHQTRFFLTPAVVEMAV